MTRTRLALGLLLLAAGACDRGEEALDPHAVPSPSVLAAIPLGAVAGAAENDLRTRVHNPLEGDPQAIRDGERLFGQMNCASCHGYDLDGGMCPNLVDDFWRYGGTPAEIYNSIAQGRPQGMPAFGPLLPAEEIWRIVAYIQSMGGAVPPEGALPGTGQREPRRALAPEMQKGRHGGS